jgi:hypothetical protein
MPAGRPDKQVGELAKERRGRGGSQPGAGRPPGKDEFGLTLKDRQDILKQAEIDVKSKRQSFIDTILDRSGELIEAAFTLALGVTVSETGKDGETNVYTRPPDGRMLTELLNRGFGKPADRIETDNGDQLGTILVGVYRPSENTYGSNETSGDPSANRTNDW